MTSLVTAESGPMFRSLRVRNFRLWFVGQSVSLVGYWMQVVAQAILVLDLSDSGAVLGMVTALQYAPVFVVGPWAGVLSDRIDKRTLMLVTQTALMAVALALGVLVIADEVTIPWVFLLAALAGTAWAFDQPVRRTIVTELVADADAANAVSLNGALNYGAKTAGPAVAGLLIATVGIGWCFVLNGVTSIAVIVALLRMNSAHIRRPVNVARARGQIRDGFRYAWSNRPLRVALIMTATVAVTFNWQVVLPLFAERDLGGTSGTYAFLVGMFSTGSVLGTLWLARRRTVESNLLRVTCLGHGAALALLAVSPATLTAAIAGLLVGAFSSVVINGSVASLQLSSAPDMRGRVMSVFAIIAMGGVGVGGPICGWIAERFGARAWLGVGATTAVAAASVGLIGLRRTETRL